MDALDRAIAEVRAVREHDEMLEAERDAIISAMEKWLMSGELNGIFTEGQALAISAAFAAGWVGGREHRKGRGEGDG